MKKMLSMMLAGTMILSLAACGSSSTDTGSAAADQETGEEVTNEAVEAEGFVPALDTDTEATLYFVGSYGNFEALDQVALDFQTYYPGVEVVYTKLDDYRNDLANRFATGQEIDLFMVEWWDEAYDLNQNIIDNAEDLSSAGLDLSSLQADLLAQGQVDGAQVVMPLYLQSWGYLVNLDILEACGVEIPTTYDELIDACGQLAEAGYEQPVYINSSIYGRTFTGYYMSRRMAGSDEVAALDETLERADALYDSGYVNAEGDTLEDGYEAMILRFFEGDVPFQSISLGNYSGTKKREAKSEAFTENPFDYAYIPAPYGDESGTYMNQLGSIYVGAYKDSQQLDLANEFLRFMLTDEEMGTFAEIKNLATANTNVGLEDFPYLAAADKFYVTEDGIDSLDEERALNVFSKYDIGGDHSEMYEKMNDYLENGIN